MKISLGSVRKAVCSQACAPKCSVVVIPRPRLCLFLSLSLSVGFTPCFPALQSQICHSLCCPLAFSGAFPSMLPPVIKGTSVCTGFTAPRTCVRFSCPAAIFPLTSPRRDFLPPRFMSLPMRVITTQCIMF